jgi:hypothetical protein
MFDVEEDFKEIHDDTVKTFHYLCDNCNEFKFHSYPIDEMSTEFQIENHSGVKISVSHSIATGGDIETTLINCSGKKIYDTLEYHDSRENLVKYLKEL